MPPIGIEDAAGDLDVRQERVDGQRLVGRKAEIERLEAERLLHPLILEVAADHLLQVAQRAAGHDPEVGEVGHRRGPVHVPPDEPEPVAIHLARAGEVRQQVGPAARLDRLTPLDEAIEDAAAVVTGAIGKVDAVARVDLHQREVVLEPAADVAEELLPVLRHHHQRGAGIEGEALRFPATGTTAGLEMLLQYGHVPAGMRQAHRGGEAPDTRPDHHGTAAASGSG